MKYSFSLILCSALLLTTSAHAAQRMRDMSLSVEDTMKQPTITPKASSGDTGFDESVQIDPSIARQLQELRGRDPQNNGSVGFGTTPNGNFDGPNNGGILAPPPRGTRGFGGNNQRGFMSEFCSTSIASGAGKCQESRATICERFGRATVVIQRLLDRAISCEYNASGASNDCDGLDAGRLDLLKQYWQDEDASYTILYLPDMVMNYASKCSAPVSTPALQNNLRNGVPF